MSAIELPTWWSACLEKCDHTNRNSFVDSSESRNIINITEHDDRCHEPLPYRLPCDHLLEFDLQGNSVELGGYISAH